MKRRRSRRRACTTTNSGRPWPEWTTSLATATRSAPAWGWRIMLEVDTSESKRRDKVHFRKTWDDYLLGNGPWFLLLYVPALALVAVDVVYSGIGRQQMAFYFLVGFFLLFTLLILWGHRRTGRLQKFSGRDEKTNREIVRALCQKLGWNVILKKPSYDMANIQSYPRSRLVGGRSVGFAGERSC